MRFFQRRHKAQTLPTPSKEELQRLEEARKDNRHMTEKVRQDRLQTIEVAKNTERTKITNEQNNFIELIVTTFTTPKPKGSH